MLYSVIAGGALLFLFAIWLWSRRTAASVSGRRSESLLRDGRPRERAREFVPETRSVDFRAVIIDSIESNPPCQTAIELADTRFLLAEAPTLPLPDCNSSACRCFYVRYVDRRSEERRASHDLHEAVCQVSGISDRRGLGNRRDLE